MPVIPCSDFLQFQLIPGISYLSRGQEEEARRSFTSLYDNEFLESHSSSKDIKDKGIYRMADVLFTERMKSKISEWKNALLQVKNGGQESHDSTKESVKQFETIFYMMRPAVKLHGFSSRQLRLIQLVMFLTERRLAEEVFLLVFFLVFITYSMHVCTVICIFVLTFS